MLGLGAAVFGFRPAGAAPGVVGGALLALLVGWSISWVFMAIASRVRNIETIQMVNFLVMLPLAFGSSTYVPVRNLPGWLQVFAAVNPLTPAIDGARGLVLGQPDGGAVLTAVVVWLVLAVLAAPLAAHDLRRP
jgi:ABC-2 type transport system permease protein